MGAAELGRGGGGGGGAGAAACPQWKHLEMAVQQGEVLNTTCHTLKNGQMAHRM